MIRIRNDGVRTNYEDVQVLSGPESTTATATTTTTTDEFWSYLYVHTSVVWFTSGLFPN